ncbi:MAG: PIG-L family deacetylase [Ardenticatenales bacterium]|nr:PIG-L family deacetylase [Ardenticatenales bacterium]
MAEERLELNERGLPPVRRALVIMAHPDDPEFFVGGTIGLLAEQGTEVRVLLVTDGSKGSDDRALSTRELIRLRREEQREATRRLGALDVIFFDYPDGELRHEPNVLRDVVRELRRFQPEMVLTNDPQRFYYESGYINHTDHRTIGAIVIDAVFPAARNFRYFPALLEEGFEPWYVRELWLAAPLEANHEVNTDTTAETRLQAILAHTSQVGDGTWIRERFAEMREKGEPLLEKFKRIELGGPPQQSDEEPPKDHAEAKLEASEEG